MKHSREGMSILEPSMEEAVDELIMGVVGGTQHTVGSGDDSISGYESAFSDEEDGAAGEGDSESSEDGLGEDTTNRTYDLYCQAAVCTLHDVASSTRVG